MANSNSDIHDDSSQQAGARRVQPVLAVAQRLGFEPSLWGWQRTYADLRLELVAVPGGYRLSRAGIVRSRECFPPDEIALGAVISPIAFRGALYRLWRGVHGSGEPPLTDLALGREWMSLQRKVAQVVTRAPSLLVDRDFLRHCLRRIAQQLEHTAIDCEACFEQVGEQLRIQVGETVLFCPARGDWFGMVRVSVRDLLRQTPRRFCREQVPVVAHADGLSLAGRRVAGRWEDESIG